MPLNEAVVAGAVNAVLDDVSESFGDALEQIDAPAVDLLGAEGLEQNQMRAASEDLVVVPWVYRCRHIGPFLGVQPTDVVLLLRGATFVQVSEPDDRERWWYYRYIDYLGALNQMGISVSVRPAPTREEPE
jgi:hypothetical protein